LGTADYTVAVIAGIAVAVVAAAGIAVAVVAAAPVRDNRVAARVARPLSHRNPNRTLCCHLTLSRNFYNS